MQLLEKKKILVLGKVSMFGWSVSFLMGPDLKNISGQILICTEMSAEILNKL